MAVDLRVDDHPAPVDEIERLFDIHRLLFPRPQDLEFVPIDEPLARELRALLTAQGHDPGPGKGYDEALRKTLFAFVGTENLEERWAEGAEVEKRVLEYLRSR